MQQVFKYSNAKNDDLNKAFRACSAIQIKNIFSNQFCQEVVDYIKLNELKIIKEYENDNRGLVIEEIKNNKYIKYFDKPLSCNFDLFKRFITSKIVNLSAELLEDDVFLNAFELHSRYASASEIPVHQDNAYFGLVSAKSLTFYISLNTQSSETGGLQYYKVPISNTLEHSPSDKPGFSLTIKKDSDYKDFEVFKPEFQVGDCTIHHSTSIHFAQQVPKNSDRVMVIRLSFHGLSDHIKDGHEELYKKMVEINRGKLYQPD